MRVAARLHAGSVEVQTSLVVGPPALAIRNYTHTYDVDLIAIATHGHSGVSRLLLGSVTEAVVTHG